MAALLYLRPFDLWVVQHIGIRVSSLLNGYDDNPHGYSWCHYTENRFNMYVVCSSVFPPRCGHQLSVSDPIIWVVGWPGLGIVWCKCWLAVGSQSNSSPSPIFEWPKHMNIDYFYLTNQMTASLSCNSFVTEDNQKLHNTVALSWLFITSITKELLLQESESVISLAEI